MPRRPMVPCLGVGCPTLLPGPGFCTGCLRAAMVPVTLVAGPPCAGKTSYVAERANRGDLVLDYDALLLAMGGQLGDDAFRPFVSAARDAVLELVGRGSNLDVPAIWAIHSGALAKERQLYRSRYRASVVVLETPEEVCVERAQRSGRPSQWAVFIRRWWDEYQPDSANDTRVSWNPKEESP